jgi:hypothetical protein
MALALSDSPDSRIGTLSNLAQRGITLCRQGNWKEGVPILVRVAEGNRDGVELPGQFYSYLGYGIALVDNNIKEGLALCQHAIKKEFYQPDNFANLARTYLLSGRRRGAHKALRRGLRIAPQHPGLRQVQRQMGLRRRLPIPFLPRSHAVNRFLGQLSYQLFKPRRW